MQPTGFEDVTCSVARSADRWADPAVGHTVAVSCQLDAVRFS